MIVDPREADQLKADAKTLEDVSAMLEKEFSFHALPGILNGIASDIRSVFDRKDEEVA